MPASSSTSSSERTATPLPVGHLRRERGQIYPQDPPLEDEGRFRRAHLPLGAIVTLLIVLAVEAGVHFNHHRMFDVSFLSTRWKRALLTDRSLHDDVVIFGDSRFFHIDPAVVAAALAEEGEQLTVTNLTWPYYGAEAFPWTLESYLHYRPEPRLILVNIMPNYIGFPVEHSRVSDAPAERDRLYSSLPARTLVPILIREGRRDLLRDYVAFSIMPPTLKYRWQLLRHVRGRFVEDYELIYNARENLRRVPELRETGAFVLHSQVGPPEDGFREPYLELFGPMSPDVDPEVRRLLESFLERAAERGIPVLLMNAPLPQAAYELDEELSIKAAYEELVAEWQSQFPNLIVVEPLLDPLPHRYFGDFGHLNLDGDAVHREMYREALEARRSELRRAMGLDSESEGG